MKSGNIYNTAYSHIVFLRFLKQFLCLDAVRDANQQMSIAGPYPFFVYCETSMGRSVARFYVGPPMPVSNKTADIV